MSWAQRRKLIYMSGIVIFVIVFIIIPLIINFYKAPTCTDGKQNGVEQGIDCGGPCTLLCNNQYAPLTVKWSRFFKVDEGVYNVLAYIENSNLNALANNFSYTFKLYDKTGILLKERMGQTFAPPNKIIAIFEAEMLTGKQVPSRVEFSITSPAVWQKQMSDGTGLAISESTVTRADTAPRLTATLTNKTTNLINNIEAVGIVYDVNDNTIAFSRTVIDFIKGKESKSINFNWPKPFPDTYARTEIVLKIMK